MKIRKGDTVKIISGNERGRTGKVFSVLPKEGRIAVEGINVARKHTRPRRQGQKGEVVSIPAFFPSSRATMVCSACGKAARFGAGYEEGKKVRVCRKCGAKN